MLSKLALESVQRRQGTYEADKGQLLLRRRPQLGSDFLQLLFCLFALFSRQPIPV